MRRYKGKYSAPKRLPWASWLLILLAVLSLSTGTVIAYLAASSNPVENTFIPETQINPQISETFNNKVKSNVAVNVGDPGYAVYVRAAIVATWKKTETVDGVTKEYVHSKTPVLGTDYSLDLNLGTNSNWTQKDDGYYYYSQPVISGNTDVLIESCQPLKEAPEEDYTLSVEIIAQTIQALGTTDDGSKSALQDAWGTQ